MDDTLVLEDASGAATPVAVANALAWLLGEEDVMTLAVVVSASLVRVPIADGELPPCIQRELCFFSCLSNAK